MLKTLPGLSSWIKCRNDHHGEAMHKQRQPLETSVPGRKAVTDHSLPVPGNMNRRLEEDLSCGVDVRKCELSRTTSPYIGRVNLEDLITTQPLKRPTSTVARFRIVLKKPPAFVPCCPLSTMETSTQASV